MRISVIIPTYKPKGYLWQCLDSLAEQELGNYSYEVILVLNGPKEPYCSEIKKYISSRPSLNITFLYNKIPGVSAARNLALDTATGDYITFIDDDDYVSDSFLRNMADVASADRMVMAKAIAFDDNTKEAIPYRITEEFKKFSSKGVMPAFKVRKIYCGVWMKLIPKVIIGESRFDITLRNSEDALFMFIVSKRFNKMVCAPHDTIYYRRVRIDGTSFICKDKKLKHALIMIFKYTQVYINSPFDYKFSFYFTRILGTIKGLFAKDTY